MIILEDAGKFVAAAERKTKELEQPMNIAVAEAGGHLVAHVRMDDAWGSQGLAVAPSMRPARDSLWLHTHDYRAAIAKAVDWLGDRYLLAKPIKLRPACPAAARVYPVRESYVSKQGRRRISGAKR
jgi:hypothetical protein